jgi:Chromate transporter
VRDHFLYLGSLGFGGPVALVGYMQRDLVERRRWFTKEEYMKSLALSQLAPGPLAAQLAICLGYVHFGCDIAPAKGQRVDQWEVPAVSDGYAAARDRIVAHVERLVAELAVGR